jgi:hypothetical protein
MWEANNDSEKCEDRFRFHPLRDTNPERQYIQVRRTRDRTELNLRSSGILQGANW